MLKIWTDEHLFSEHYRHATKLPFIYHPELILPAYRGAQCFIDAIGFYHLTSFNNIWVGHRMEEYSEALVERRKANDRPF